MLFDSSVSLLLGLPCCLWCVETENTLFNCDEIRDAAEKRAIATKDKIPLFDICQTEREKKKKRENWKEENIVYYTFYGSELQKAIRNTAKLLGNLK